MTDQMKEFLVSAKLDGFILSKVTTVCGIDTSDPNQFKKWGAHGTLGDIPVHRTNYGDGGKEQLMLVVPCQAHMKFYLEYGWKELP